MKLPLTSKTVCQSSPLWFRWCSVTMLSTSIGFLCFSLFAYNYHSISVTTLVPLLLVSLTFAAILNFYSLWFFRNEHRQADQAFRDTDCEFSSIFRNVLDGILIADSAGNCLDANPAAAAILRSSPNELIGQNISRFLEDGDAFAARMEFIPSENKTSWSRTLGRK